jgi:hypothetical protein
VCKFADFSEKHFERYFSEPLTLDDPAYPLASQALQATRERQRRRERGREGGREGGWVGGWERESP